MCVCGVWCGVVWCVCGVVCVCVVCVCGVCACVGVCVVWCGVVWCGVVLGVVWRARACVRACVCVCVCVKLWTGKGRAEKEVGGALDKTIQTTYFRQ